MAEEPQKRQVARKLWIRDLLASSYVREEGVRPNHVVLADGSHAARVHLMGVVVAVTAEGLPTLALDDGTGRITVRAFEPSAQMSRIAIGDAVLVVGRPRQFNAEIYVLPEIVRRLPDLAWLEVRKRELGQAPGATAQALPHAPAPASQPVVEDVLDESFGLTEHVLEAVRSLDQGQGADTEAVLQQVNDAGAERTIRFLLQNGDIFEVSPGRLKVLQ